MIEWLEKKRGSSSDDSFNLSGLKVRVSPTGKGVSVNEILFKKIGEYCLVGYDKDSQKLVIKKTSSVDFNGKKLWPLKKGSATIRVNPTFEAFLTGHKLNGRTIELQWNEAGYYEEVKPIDIKRYEEIVNVNKYNLKALDLYCQGMGLKPEDLTEEQLKQFELK